MNIVVVYRPWWPPLTPLRSPPSLPSLLEDSAAWRGHLFDVILKAETVSLSPQALNLSSSYSSRSKSSHKTEPIKSGTSTVLIAKQSIGGLHRMVQLLDFKKLQGMVFSNIKPWLPFSTYCWSKSFRVVSRTLETRLASSSVTTIIKVLQQLPHCWQSIKALISSFKLSILDT